jgi:hypothetical protein
MLLVFGFWNISAHGMSDDGVSVDIGKSGTLAILPKGCDEPLDNFPSHGDESITNNFYSNVAARRRKLRSNFHRSGVS